MAENEKCPHCLTSLAGEEIPKQNRHYYGGKTHFSRTIGVEIPGFYDGILFWQCPDCGGRWHRFAPGDYRYARAIPFVVAKETGEEADQ